MPIPPLATLTPVIDTTLEKYHLTPDKEVVMDLIGQIFQGELDYKEFPFELEGILDRVDEDLVAFESDIYLDVFMPYESELDALYEANKSLFVDVMSALNTQFAFTFEEPRFAERLSTIAEQFLKGEYDEERTLRALTKGTKPGGLDFTEDVAERVIAFLNPFIDRVRFGEETIVVPEVAQEVTEDIHPMPAELMIEHTDIVPQALVDTPEELVKKKSPRVAIKPLEQVPVKTEQEKLRSDVRAKAQTSQYMKTVIPSVSTVTPPIMPVDMPQTAKQVTEGITCDLLEEHEIEELIKTREGIDERIADMPKIHDELRTVFLEVVEKFSTKLQSAELCERFHSLVISRLKNVRNTYETRDLVVAPIAAGGLGFSFDDASEFLTYLEAECTKLQLEWQAELETQKEAFVTEKRNALFGKGNTPPRTMIATDTNTDDMRGIVERKPEPVTMVMADNLKTTRPIMQDVHSEAPTLDPIEELRSYSLDDFHRLSRSPVEAALKIEQKIGILGDWMYVKRAEGIDAWKDSKIMRMYREQLQQSIIGDMPLTEVIERRKAATQPFLTTEEVAALTDLSSRLRK